MKFADDLTTQVLAELSRRVSSSDPVGLPTGIEELDELLGGLPRQMLSYLVGDSAVGKSLFASYLLLETAIWLAKRGSGPASAYILDTTDQITRRHVHDKERKPPVVVFWSLEMSEAMVATRLLTQATKLSTGITIDSGKLIRGKMEGTPGADLVGALKKGYQVIQEVGHNLVLVFRDQTVADFRATLTELALTHDICLVVIDYFRLIQDVIMESSGAGRQEAVSRDLMTLAREFDCHVLSIFDINREGQKNRKPRVTDMKWGTAPQYDADIVLLMWIDRYTKEQLESGADVPIQHVTIEIAKARDAPKGRIDLALEVKCGQFESWKRGGQSGEGENTRFRKRTTQ